MRRLLLAAVVSLGGVLGTPLAVRGQDVLVDRVLAVVDGQLVTLSDLRTARGLGFLQADEETDALNALIDRVLIVGEASRYAVEEPTPAEIEARLAALTRALGEQQVAAVMKQGGLSEPVLRQQIRDELVLALYMAQRFAATAMPTDTEVDAYVNAHRDELSTAAGTSAPTETVRLARERLTDERRARLVADWVAGLRRRANVSTRSVTP